MIEVNDENWEEKVIKASKEKPVLVDFWSPRCGPCMIIAPVLEKLEQEYNGKFILAKLNVDENPETARKYEIMSIPTVVLFKGNEQPAGFIGARTESFIRNFLDKQL
ncbi:MAG: thioredoxin [Candidatus Aenigmarchaeota archaeon]|nr:thioredoxin [Candidatus Aenigmarchaeota archaeon]OYT57660.1 MAG: thioredoxin [Candidatus Aenigmarchaeota archaeon ex4484_14]